MPGKRRTVTPQQRRTTLVRIAVLMFLRRREQALAYGVKKLKSGEISNARLSATFLHLALLLGVPSALDALGRLKRAVGTVELAPFSRDASKGQSTFDRIYGKKSKPVLRALHAVHPLIPEWIIEDVYGSVFHRPGLTLAEKELVTLTILALQDHAPQFRSHYEGARRSAVGVAEIRSTLRLAQRMTGINLDAYKT